MKTIIVILSVLAASGLLFAGSIQAGCGMCPSAAGKADSKDSFAKDHAINAVCPVMGNKISKDTPYSVEYKGNKIGLCCQTCVKRFEFDPDKYGEKVLGEQK